MEQKEPILYVHMLGRFGLTYKDQPIAFNTPPATKPLRLLQILLYATAANGGISRTQLLEALYEQEDLCDLANNLRVTIYRLKKILVQAGLPECEFIQVDHGTYRWNSDLPLRIDALDFEERVRSAQNSADPAAQAALYEEACALYTGVFLPALSEDDWVIVTSMKYKKLYEHAFLHACRFLKHEHAYGKILDLASDAIQIYPFEEWQSIKIGALMALDRYKEAQQYYEETAKLFFRELGVSPSQKMQDLFNEMSVKMRKTCQKTQEIQDFLAPAEYETGAFFCNLTSFRDNCRLIQRLQERTKLTAQIMICSLSDGSGRPLENPEKREVLSEHLHKAIRGSLRRGDCFTKYSPSHFLILLIGASQDNCALIHKRIVKRFAQEHKSWKKYVQYSVFSLEAAEPDIQELSLKKKPE